MAESFEERTDSPDQLARLYDVLSRQVESSDAREACSAVNLVGTLLSDEPPQSREAGRLRDLLARALSHQDRKVRSAATRVLGRLDSKEAALLLKRRLSRLARRGNRGLIVAGCAAVFAAMALLVNAGRMPFTQEQLGAIFYTLLFGGVLMLLIGGVFCTAQELRGSREELEEALRACADQSPENLALLRGELRRIVFPLAAPYPGAQQQAWDLLGQVRNYEKSRSILPIAAPITVEPVEELPLPAAPTESKVPS